jgi:hypothetical protein
MQEEFYSIIKLITGEELMALVSIDENDGDPLVILQNPITMKLISTQYGIQIKVKSWLELTNDDLFVIRPERIITMTETKNKKLIKIYKDYNENYNSFIDDIDNINSKFDDSDINTNTDTSTGKVNLSKNMGYLDSVESARKKLEEIFNKSIEP